MLVSTNRISKDFEARVYSYDHRIIIALSYTRFHYIVGINNIKYCFTILTNDHRSMKDKYISTRLYFIY